MSRGIRVWALAIITSVTVVATLFTAAGVSIAAPNPPWDGTYVSAGLGPTYGEPWCANPAPGSSIAGQQTNLALIPQEATACTLQQFQQEAINASIPARLTFAQMGTSAGGRPWYYAVVNALETAQQQTNWAHYQTIRAEELTNPAQAQADLASYAGAIKMPVFIEANIHGDEEEGDEAMMQAIRDLVTTPLGTNAYVDEVLNNTVLIVVPNMNPDGRFIGQRANSASYDMNRDFLVQSQTEVRNEVALMQQWLPTVALDMHGYVQPGLTDGLTKPHNPGLEYDLFLKWNEPRIAANRVGLAGIGEGNTQPVNNWCPNGDAPNAAGNCTSTGGVLTLAAGTAGLHEVGDQVTVTTTAVNNLGKGASVTIDGVPGYNGTWTVNAGIPLQSTTFTYTNPTTGLADAGSTAFSIVASPGGASESGTTVTINTTAPHGFSTGQKVLVAGVGVNGYNNGGQVVTITSTPLTTSFTYTLTATGLAPSGGGTVTAGTVTLHQGPAVAQGWDDWGPFYTQTYQAYLGSDSSTSEMCSSTTTGFLPGVCSNLLGTTNGRMGSKQDQYLVFWSSVHYWIPNRVAMMNDQMEIFRRGVTGAARVPCCDGNTADGTPLHNLGFWDDQQDWMVPYPKAFVIPFSSGALNVGQRADIEANNLAQWALNNGIQVTKLTSDYVWNATTYPAGSYVIWMNQALRGLALTALDAGQDVSNRINQLYAPPGAWAHGTLWGADVTEVPGGDATFNPATSAPIGAPNTLVGGVRGGTGAPSDFYSVTLRGWRQYATIAGLLHNGVLGEIADASFTSTTGGPTPAGSLIFPNDSHTAAALDAAGQAAGVYFERNVGVTKPATTLLNRAPRVAMLVNPANGIPTENFQTFSYRRIFGNDIRFLSVTTSCPTCAELSIQNAATDPLQNYDLLINTGQGWPAGATARQRLNAFFGRGGGYIGNGSSTTNFSFLTGATNNAGTASALTTPITSSSSSAGGGDALWNNVGGSASQLTGGYPASDHIMLASNVNYFSARPGSSVIDGQWNPDMAGAGGGNGPNPGFVAGLWRNRSALTNNAPILIHGLTTPIAGDRPNASRYALSAVDLLASRGDGERMWNWLTQSALWTPMTDETQVAQTITFAAIPDQTFNDPDVAINPTSDSNLPVSVAASGPCTVTSPTAPSNVHMTGAGSCQITATQAGNANYSAATPVMRTFNIAPDDQTINFAALPDKNFGDPDFTVSATATSGLTVTFTAGGPCTVTVDSVHLTGVGLCTITAHQAGNANYNAAPDVPQSFTINKGNQTITFPVQAHRTWGDPDSAVTGVSASSGLPVTFAKVSGKCSVTTAGVVHFNQANTCVVSAHQGGNVNWNPAPTVQQNVVMDKSPQTINFPQPPAKTFGDPDFNLVATSSSGLVVKFQKVTGQCTVTRAGLVHLVGPGSCTVRSFQGGNKNYLAAPDVNRTFAIN